MKEELVFFERQRFNQWFVIALFLLTIATIIYVCVSLIFMNTLDNKRIDVPILIVLAVVMILIPVGFFFFRLETVINKEGVYFRMFPFHRRFQFKPWSYISKAEVKKINQFKKFGGWGMQYKVVNFMGSGIHFGIRSKSYTISGNCVLLLTLINNKKIYIGTQKPEELSEFLVKLDAERKQK